jgi:SpoVK/Ycf46/Vps4 family AAA+-type ATPase
LTFELGQEIIEKYGRRHGEDEFGDIGILTKRDNRDYEIQDLEISNPEMTVEESYPPEISKEHEQVVEILSRKKDAKGILLMHGKPGTGKTTYIRHLIKEVDKKFIFVPPDVAAEFGSPEITKVLLEFSNCILVIEDGEKVLRARAKGMTSPISALLNLSDGLLSDALHIQVIATFNCGLDDIDPAITRKGRLLKRLVFPEMGIEQANKIRAKLKKAPLAGGKAATFTVAEIYND